MTHRVGQQLGNYRLIRFLGRGGFAEVYLGEHVRLGTYAAIKVLQTQLASQEVEHFQYEAQTIARLEHAHIVRVLDFDVVEGTPFLVMGYASGGTLRHHHPKGTVLPLPTIISYVKQLAEALQYAHDEKIIHRDIKPENMLIGRHNEILLADFGIATMVQSSRYQSTQSMVGTVTYMAPEQIQGKPRPASDQYALGVVVYEWLSGTRPFKGSFTEIATQHILAPPPSLHEKLPAISPSLEQAILIALEKDPSKRFASILAFATALEQAHQEEKTRPSLSSLSIPPTLATPAHGSVNSSQTTPPESFLSSEAISPSTIHLPRRGALLLLYRGHSKPVSSVAWSPDGTCIASVSDDGTAQVWAATTGHLIVTYTGHTKAVASIAWSPDGKRIASAGEDHTVQIWESVTGQHLFTYVGHDSGVWSLVWSPLGDVLASASDDGTVQVWEEQTGEVIFTHHSQRDSTWAVAWSPSDAYFAFQCNTNLVQICDAIDGRKIRTYRGHTKRIWAIAWSPDGTILASGGEDGTVQVWTAVKGKHLLTYRGHSTSVIAVAWSPDGAYLASAGDDQTIQIWVAATGKEIFTYRGHSRSVVAIAWSPDGAYLASASEDQTVHVWATSP